MAKEELGITEENEMTEMSEEELESVAGGYDTYKYNEIFNDSSKSIKSKYYTFGAYYDRVLKLLKSKDLTQKQKTELHFEKMHLKSLRETLREQLKEQQ